MADQGYTLTEIPGVEWIKIEPDEGSQYGVHVLIRWQVMEKAQSWGMDELEELIRAVSTARDLGTRLVANIEAVHDSE